MTPDRAKLLSDLALAVSRGERLEHCVNGTWCESELSILAESMVLPVFVSGAWRTIKPEPKFCCNEMDQWLVRWTSAASTASYEGWKFCPWCGKAKTQPAEPTKQFPTCKNCGKEIELLAGSTIWIHADGRSVACRPGYGFDFANPK